jgi:uncharacterized oxidoreductase
MTGDSPAREKGPLVDGRALEDFAGEILRRIGTPADIAAEVAAHLVRANLSGHDSHGVLRLPQYVAQARAGEIAPAARPTIVRQTSVTALVSAQRGFGHFSTKFALDWAMARAADHGLAGCAVRHSTHIGRLGEYAEHAAARGMVSVVTVGTGGPGVGGMMIHGGRSRFFGANPWCIGVPTAEVEGAPGLRAMVFDGSTSTVAEGKVRLAQAKGEALPPGCLVDRHGQVTTDPNDFYAGGALTPLGGELAGHKGYGLAMASLLLSGLSMIGDPSPSLAGASVLQDEPDARGRMAGVFVVALDPAAFGDPDTYVAMVAETLGAAKRVAPAEGRGEVLVPGEPETRTRAERSRRGVHLPGATWEQLCATAAGIGVLVPETLSGS